MDDAVSIEDQDAEDGFRAFLSYSHKDAAAAQKLHRKLESYRLPRRLLSADTQLSREYGGSGRRLGKFFRDREDLPAAQDLSEAVKEALQRSQALIVLCSPDARQSPWVAKEIRLFRALHPGRPVLAAVIAGEPDDVFPQPLLEGHEPLAADLRKDGDGPRLGFLKVVAGIAHVPLDSLIQRDAQRRIRNVMVVTGGFMLGMLVMIGMTIFAIQSRNEAQRQQAEAEGLVEYMLTDLRDKLKGSARIRVMEGVNERAMSYYDSQGDLSSLPAESLERRARILHAMGEDDQLREDLDAALAKFTEAHRVTANLLSREPNNADRIFAHAQSEYWVGYIAYLREEWPKTEARWKGYKALADRLVAKDNRNPEWLREAGYAEGNLCTYYLTTNTDAAAALKTCQTALERMRQVLALTPDDKKAKMDVANRLGWLASAYKEKGQAVTGLERLYEQHAILQTLLAKEPEDLQLLDQTMRSNMVIAEFLGGLGEMENARKANRLALKMADRLVKRDPDNKKWREWRQRTIDLKLTQQGE